MRPGGTTLSYTPFDLPKTITQSSGTITLDYDGDEQRIRKTTPDEETLYFGDLYERVTEMSSGTTSHRYYVRSPERVVAIVTRGGTKPGTQYLHVDHLGSVDALTLEDGSVEERRSYDPFGQRRNSIWGQPPPMSFSSKTTQGFTGHEGDDELGLVNMKGRIYDPKVGRFLTTDPIVSAPLSGQSWNAYSYVFNNPLSYVDPSGFEPDTIPFAQVYIKEGPNGEFGFLGILPPPDPPEQKEDEGEKVGAYVPPVDVSPTGNTAGYEPQADTTATEDWSQTPSGQFRLGLLGGVPLGGVPLAGLGEQFLDAAHLLPQRSGDFRHGLAIGQIFGGLASILLGAAGEIGGGMLSTTGIGALIGVPAMAVSDALIAGGLGNMAAGVLALATGSGSGGNGRGRVDKVDGPTFPDLKDHAARHGNGLGTNQYYNEAVAHTKTGRPFKVWHEGEFKQAYITRLGPESFRYTATDLGGKTIFTHMDVKSEYLLNIGITLPKGF